MERLSWFEMHVLYVSNFDVAFIHRQIALNLKHIRFIARGRVLMS